MQAHTREHHELMEQFERQRKLKINDREENRDHWKMGHVYKNGQVNELFIAFREGYALGRTIERMAAQ